MVRIAWAAFVTVVIAACGGNHNGVDICKNTVPPPPACMTSCDPQPGAPNTCPAGFHCTPDGKCDAFCTANGGECGDGYHCTSDGRCESDACTGIACQVVDCAKQGKPSTTISGTVFAPNGTLPLYGITVYVPNEDPGPLLDGAVCNRCSDDLPGRPIARATSDEAGKFTIMDVPAGNNIPLVIVSGKWRRQITIPNVASCTDNPIASAADTTLPKSATDMTPLTKSVDMPKIAISTGSADALECLPRKLGVADSEITTSAGTGHIHLYTDTQSAGQGAAAIGATQMADSQTLWNDVNALKKYDILILSCEGQQASNTKSQTAMNNVKAYADLGGRVFLSHWHNIWVEGATTPPGPQKPAVWTGIATWNNGGTTFNAPPDPPDIIDEQNNSKGTAFATWMINVMGSTTRDQIAITEGKQTATGVDNGKAERWVYWNSGGQQFPQNFQFTTPNEVDPGMRCGKVVFSDMHVSSGSTSQKGTAYPGGCSSAPLTPQEKALAFMFFDISSCVGTIF